VDSTYILLSRRRKPFEFIDHWLSVEMYFVEIGSLGKAERMSQYRVFRLITVTV